MTTFFNIGILTVDFISLLITLPGYMFIIVLNILDWQKNERLDISDQLISGLSLFNLSHRILYASVNYIVFANKFLGTSELQLVLNMLSLSLIFCTLLFSTWLAIHFCLKIVNINHKVYIYTQRMFPKIFPWIHFLSIFASVLLSIPGALGLTQKNYQNSTAAPWDAGQSFFELLCNFIPSFLCFFLILTSALKIIFSLKKHIEQICSNTMEFRAQIVEPHISAIKTVISLLAFNLLHFTLHFSIIILHFNIMWVYVLPILYALCHIFGVAIFIHASSKLRKKMYRFVICDCYGP
ncbi:hypothetical protein GDO81_008007 [Engystomops pustulosus]|uniref:Taste receptor type 2 n=1 Tax=Engystomops pustulosus TaxID=76066 RepID=A0AAV7CC95_ENGPU|nr:hypothetical protein GDO81_008007 [Engystomops pustulosus]